MFLSASIIACFVAVPVIAQAEEMQKTTTATTAPAPTTSTTTTTPKTSDSTAKPATTVTEDQLRASRLTDYKKTFKETLTGENKTRIENRCVASQNVVKGKTTSNTEVTANRTKAYNEITSKLHTLSGALAAKSIDTALLDSDVLTLQTKITAFTVANATYQQALSDVAALDCKTDPVAFKAALVAARSDQETVFKLAQDVRTYLTGTIKPLLQTLKSAAETGK